MTTYLLWHSFTRNKTMIVGSKGFKLEELGEYGHYQGDHHVLFGKIISLSIIANVNDYRYGNYSYFVIKCSTVERPRHVTEFEIKMGDRNELDKLYATLTEVVQKRNNAKNNLIGI